MEGTFGQYDIIGLNSRLALVVHDDGSTDWLEYSEDRVPYDHTDRDSYHISENLEYQDEVEDNGVDLTITIPSGVDGDDREAYTEGINDESLKLRHEDGNQPYFIEDIDEKGQDIFENEVNYDPIIKFIGTK